MGQYYRVANIDKKEFMSPSDWGEGTKLMEFAYPFAQSMTLSALAILLADGNNRGGGDLHSSLPIIGSWKYNKIAIVGDYADKNNDTEGLWDPDGGWKNVSRDILIAMSYAPHFAKELSESIEDAIESPRQKFFLIPSPVLSLVKSYDLTSNEYNQEAVDFFSHLYPDSEKRQLTILKLLDIIHS